MSYVALQAAAKTILEGVTGYLDEDGAVTLGDYGVLDTGLYHCAVFRPGTIPDGSEAAAYRIDREYHILVDIFRKWVDDRDTLQLFAVFRDAVFAQLDKYPTLDLADNVRVRGIFTDGDPVDVRDENDLGPFFVMQRIRIRVRKSIQLSGGEYA